MAETTLFFCLHDNWPLLPRFKPNIPLNSAEKQMNKDLQKQFTILKKCHGKLECLIYEMLFIKDKKPKLNIQSDSIKAKLFT